MSVIVKSDQAAKINEKLTKLVIDEYNLTPAGIINTLDLLHVNYEKIAEGCHYRKEGGV